MDDEVAEVHGMPSILDKEMAMGHEANREVSLRIISEQQF